MAMMSLLLSCLSVYPEVLLAILCFLLSFFYFRRHHILPTTYPVVGMLPGVVSQLHRLHEFSTDILSVTGCTFLIKGGVFTNLLVTADPANINHIFNANFSNYPKGPEFLEIFDILGGGIFNADFDSWKSQRRMAHGLIAEQRFRIFVVETSRRKVAEGIVPLLEMAVREGAPLDLQDVFLRFTFDVTSILVMGADPGCLSPGLPAVPFAKAMDDAEEVLLLRHILPAPMWKALRWVGVWEERRLTRAWETIDGFVEDLVSKKKEELCKSQEDSSRKEDLPSPDLLTSYLKGAKAVVEKSDGVDFRSDLFLRDTAVNLMLAGRDTTAAGLSWFFWLVCTHPEVEAKILDELRAHLEQQQKQKQKEEGDSDKDKDMVLFNAEELSPLVYLHAAMLEALRLYPPVPFEHKGAAESDVLPSGHRVNSEMKILVSLYAMGRMEGVWGENCREFKPERWISDRGRIRHEPSYKFLSFNSGPRTCLGRDIAFTQMKAVAAAVLWNFEVEVVEGHRVEPKVSIMLHMRYGLMVRIKSREKKGC